MYKPRAFGSPYITAALLPVACRGGPAVLVSFAMSVLSLSSSRITECDAGVTIGRDGFLICNGSSACSKSLTYGLAIHNLFV
jgi:hypothetical protein